MFMNYKRKNGEPHCPQCDARLDFEYSHSHKDEGPVYFYCCSDCEVKFYGDAHNNKIVEWVNPPVNPTPDPPRGKARLDLIPPVALFSMGEALTHGVDKHGEHNWRQKKIDIVKRCGSALRHIYKFLAGHDIDTDSGVHHLGCAMASLAVVLESLRIHPGADNRCPMPDHKLTDFYEQ